MQREIQEKNENECTFQPKTNEAYFMLSDSLKKKILLEIKDC